MAGENGLVLGDSVDVGFDDSTQESVVQVGQVVTVAVAVRSNSAIDSSLRKWLAYALRNKLGMFSRRLTELQCQRSM